LLFGSIPTVVYGLIGALLLVPLIRSVWAESSGMSLLSAALMLSLVIAPTMVLFFLDSFRSTPTEFAQIASALGGQTIQYQLYVLLPYHRRSIGVGISLGLARAMGDTMIALMIAGSSIRIPHHLTDSVRTLTAHIALLFAGDFDSMAFRSIFASGLILFGLTVVLLGAIHRLRGEAHA
jgi:phosphate transport system permease protein